MVAPRDNSSTQPNRGSPCATAGCATGGSSARAASPCAGSTANASSGSTRDASPAHLPTSPPPHPTTPRPWRPEGAPADPTQPFPPTVHPYSPHVLGPQPAGTVPVIFEPTEEDHASLFRLLSDPAFSLLEAAHIHGTSLPALSAWMARPEIAAQLDAFEAAQARKIRQSAAAVAPQAVNALASIAHAYTHAESNVPLAPNTEARTQRTRQAENTRRACWILYRFLRYYAIPPRPAPIPRAPVVADSHAQSVPIADPPSRPSLPPLESVAGVLAEILKQAAQDAEIQPADDGTPLQAVSSAQGGTAQGGTALRAVSSPSTPPPPAPDSPSRPSTSRPPRGTPVPLTISASARARPAADTS